MGVYSLQTKVGRLRRDEARRSSFVKRESWNQFRVAPTCPPSTQLHVRGGRMYADYNATWASIDDYEHRAWTVPALTADVVDSSSIGVTVTFTNANWYQFFVLELRMPDVIEEPSVDDWRFYLHDMPQEFETAGEAEVWMQSEEFQYDPDENCCCKHPAYPDTEFVAYPLCGLVLRNDGQVGVSGAILPIDMVNRARSYIWPTDMRPITSIYEG